MSLWSLFPTQFALVATFFWYFVFKKAMGSYIREREFQMCYKAGGVSRKETRSWLWYRMLHQKWLRCNLCKRWGKYTLPEYLPANVPAFLDLDHPMILLCVLCRDGAYPQLTLHFFRRKFPIDVARLIEFCTYPEWVNHVSTWLP